MESNEALTALSALAQETRLRLFRILVIQSPDGLPAGEIARALNIPPNTLSFHLSHLTAAGLIQSRREGRSLHYSVVSKGIRDLLAFLSDDCCGGRPELCGVSPLDRAAEAIASGSREAESAFVEDIFDDPRR